MLAVFFMTAVLAIEAIALVHMRGAAIPAEALPWINPVPRLSLFAVSSIFLILFKMAHRELHQRSQRITEGHLCAGGQPLRPYTQVPERFRVPDIHDPRTS